MSLKTIGQVVAEHECEEWKARAEKAETGVARLKMRVDDLKLAFGDGNVGWFDRAMAAERQRDEARAEVKRLQGEARLMPTEENDGPEPGEPICETDCPCCGAHLEIEHGDDPGEIACIGTAATPEAVTPPTPYATSERGEAYSLLCGLPDIEYQIAKRIIERLAQGLRQYGPWPADDRRDMREEAMQEVLDAAIYSARALTRDTDLDDKRGCEGCP